jgi:hypothetical protein
MTVVPRFPSSWDEPYRRPDESQNLNPFARSTRGAGVPSPRSRSADSGSRESEDDPANGGSVGIVSAALAGAESPRQREIASRIYDKLKAGYSVDDVAGLIGELSQAAAEQSQRSALGGSPPRGASFRQGKPSYPKTSSDFNPFKGYR